jgi:hypothetical protein
MACNRALALTFIAIFLTAPTAVLAQLAAGRLYLRDADVLLCYALR